MKPTKIISFKKSGRNVYYLTCDNGKEYKTGALAKIIGISGSALRLRLNRWGPLHPDVFRNKSRQNFCKQPKRKKIDLDIVEGDLAGKYNGRRTEVERRHLLDKIPGPGSFELGLI